MATKGKNFSKEYKKYITKEQRVPRTAISPNNVYRISSYETSAGEVRTLNGYDETILFVTGVYKRVVYGVKLSRVRPDLFFEWTRTVIKQTNVLEEEKELISFSELSPPIDLTGDRFYRNYIKNSGFLKRPAVPFRSYKLDGIRYASEIYFKKSILESYYA